MSTIQVRSMGSYGFDVTSLSGLGLSTADAATTGTRVSDAQTLASAIRQALSAARVAGVQAFHPSDEALTLPVGMTDAWRDELFNTVIGRAYSGGPISLSDWSRAVDELEHWAGQQASMLPPEAGGGSRNVRGIWYVNGMPWSLSELFTVNRVNTLSEIDRMVADSLNVIAANNQAAKSLTSLMKELFSRYYDMGASDLASKSQIELDGQADIANPISYAKLLAYADKYIGSNSTIRKVLSLSLNDAAPYSASENYSVGDYVSYGGEIHQASGTNTPISADYSPTTGYAQWDTASYDLNKDGTKELWQVFELPYPGPLLKGVAPGTRYDWRQVADYSSTHKYIDKGEFVKYDAQYYELIKYDKKPVFGDNYTLGKLPTETEFWKPHAGNVLRNDMPPSANWTLISEPGLSRVDFRALIDEVETIIGAFGADNQVAQLRNETLFNSRSNLLEGLGTFLKAQQTTRSTLARNV